MADEVKSDRRKMVMVAAYATVALFENEKTKKRKETKGRIFYAFSEEEWDDIDDGTVTPILEDMEKRKRVYTKLGSTVSIGGVITVEESEDGSSVYPSTERYLSRWPIKEHIVKWQAEDDTQKTVWAMEKKKKADKIDELLEMIRPLKKYYHSLVSSTQRAAFLARLQVYITR